MAGGPSPAFVPAAPLTSDANNADSLLAGGNSGSILIRRSNRQDETSSNGFGAGPHVDPHGCASTARKIPHKQPCSAIRDGPHSSHLLHMPRYPLPRSAVFTSHPGRPDGRVIRTIG